MKITKISLLVSVIVVLSSCTFTRYIQGTVVDVETKLPIDNVEIRIENIPDSVVVEDFFIPTDSLGNFKIISPTAGLFVCPKIVLSFEKRGYNKITKNYRNWNDNVVIVLEKQVKQNK